MDYREAQELSLALHGPFWKFVKGDLEKQVQDFRSQASRILPENMKDENDRSDLLSRSNMLEDLVNQIPTKINEEVKRLELEQQKGKQ